MSRNVSIFATVIACIVTTIGTPGRALASNKTPIYYAAHDYREAVRTFEQLVLRTPYISQPVERLVDDWEDSTSRLKTAARDPLRFDRLASRFVQTDALYSRVELTFFGDPIFAPDPQLDACWSTVSQAHANLVEEIRFLQELRRSRRGRSGLTVAPSGRHVGHHTTSQFSVPQSRPTPASLYSSDYTPAFRAEAFGPRPALSRLSPRPVLGSRSVSRLASPSVSRQAVVSPEARFEQDGRNGTLTRRTISTREDLRDAVIGAMLQRR